MLNFLTTEEMAKELRITRQTLYEWRKLGMPHTKIGRNIRYEREKVVAWIEQQNSKK